MNNATDITRAAREAAAGAKTWADLHNALFDPLDGILAKAYPTAAGRRAFLASPAYSTIQQLLEEATTRTGLVKGAEPLKSGRFVVRVPRSMHAALEREAQFEKVSLNQLVLSKLALQLQDLSSNHKADIIRAFVEVRNGYSADRVVADPAMDRAFLEACRRLGVPGKPFDLNWALINARKNRLLTYLPKTRKYTAINPDAYEHASEIAVRYVQRAFKEDGKEPSLDRIICDPELAKEFDKAAARISPGFQPLDYRWVALGLRKANRLKAASELVEAPKLELVGAVSSKLIASLPAAPGLYSLCTADQNLFVGETVDLKARVQRHFDVAGPALLPDWILGGSTGPVSLSVLSTPSAKGEERKAMELAFIKSFRPVFNYLEKIRAA
ncbi:MAG: toxin-antitoxin system HicB family antitoxin [Phycisphaerales bacterium]|nr:toxin-antitoxin system HicB family antitoxin [Phycisphaerales bacterium]